MEEIHVLAELRGAVGSGRGQWDRVSGRPNIPTEGRRGLVMAPEPITGGRLGIG